jgi:hypothetical protein
VRKAAFFIGGFITLLLLQEERCFLVYGVIKISDEKKQKSLILNRRQIEYV